MRIAILGANSYIAKGLVECFKLTDYEVVLFSRQPEHNNYLDFNSGSYTTIINCIGKGSPKDIIETGNYIYDITMRYDDMCIDYLKHNPDTTYINMSSGSVYGDQFVSCPVLIDKIQFDMDSIDFYTKTKLISELKHRMLYNLNIIDIRIFSYFSKHADLSSDFLINQLLKCLINRKPFITYKANIWRDYIVQEDLFNLVLCFLNHKGNTAIDAYSNNPVSKYDLINYFITNHNLEVAYLDSADTTRKYYYYSMNKKASYYGYKPIYNSLEGIKEHSNLILRG